MSVRRVIRADGKTEVLEQPVSIPEIRKLIGADTLDTVNMRDGWIMFVDDGGHDKALPPNREATALYRSICKPGTEHWIAGDVVLALDAEFGI